MLIRLIIKSGIERNLNSNLGSRSPAFKSQRAQSFLETIINPFVFLYNDGEWAKGQFGEEEFESLGLVVAGTNSKEFEIEILNLFDRVIFHKDTVYHTYLVEKT